MKILSIIFIIFIYSIYKNKYYKIHNIKIKSEKVHKKVKFIQISDYHLNPFINLKSLERHINKFQADFVFLTGDFINRSTRPKDFSKMEDFLKIFSSEVFFVSGNHEEENENCSLFFDILNKYHVKLFDNKNAIRGDININGKFYNGKTCNLKCFNDKYNILLIHDPLDFIYNEDKNFDLVLSGHLHGGQVRLPFIGAFIDPYFNLFPKYSKGFYKIRQSILYITSGMGSKFILRTFNPCEMIFFTLDNED